MRRRLSSAVGQRGQRASGFFSRRGPFLFFFSRTGDASCRIAHVHSTNLGLFSVFVVLLHVTFRLFLSCREFLAPETNEGFRGLSVEGFV